MTEIFNAIIEYLRENCPFNLDFPTRFIMLDWQSGIDKILVRPFWLNVEWEEDLFYIVESSITEGMLVCYFNRKAIGRIDLANPNSLEQIAELIFGHELFESMT